MTLTRESGSGGAGLDACVDAGTEKGEVVWNAREASRRALVALDLFVAERGTSDDFGFGGARARRVLFGLDGTSRTATAVVVAFPPCTSSPLSAVDEDVRARECAASGMDMGEVNARMLEDIFGEYVYEKWSKVGSIKVLLSNVQFALTGARETGSTRFKHER